MINSIERALRKYASEAIRANTVSSLSKVLAQKFGYSDIEAMKMDSRKRFSLLENGIADQPSTRLLLINVSCENYSIY